MLLLYSHSTNGTFCCIAHIQPRVHVVTLFTFSQGFMLLHCSHSAKWTCCYIAYIQPRVHSAHILPRVRVTLLTISQGCALLEFFIQPRVYIVTLLTFNKWYMLLHCSHSAKGTCCYITDIQPRVHVVTTWKTVV